MRNVLSNDVIDLAIEALQRARNPDPFVARDNLDAAIRELAVLVKIEGINPDDKGISPMVMPVIIQLHLLSSFLG
jgi:hypothetical protein